MHIFRILIPLTLITFTYVPLSIAKPKKTATTQTLTLELAKKALEYTNQFRIKKGLSPLIWDGSLATIALNHSKNMGTHKVGFGHDGFNKRIATLPVHPRSAAENVFICYNMRGDLAFIAIDGWIKSAGHLKNIVGSYTHCGIGVYCTAQGYWYFTQIFASYR